ncbi:MAG: ATP-binding protein [Candidatus Palauibacterales bacterium]|nr:ATP-binding protein [Candidatus Palauibacterales bacterium]
MAENQRMEILDLLVLRAPDEKSWSSLREAARELGCTLEPFTGDPMPAPAGYVPAGTPGLEDATALCRALLEGTRDEVLVADENGTVTFASRRLASLAGHEPESAVGRPADDILRAIDLPSFDRLRGMLTRVSSARTEATLVDLEGRSRPVLLRGVSTRLTGDRRRFVWFITELTRVRSVERANRILRSELETQSRLLALVSHELRTPLNVILGQLSLLQAGLRGELGAEQKDSVQRAARAGQSLLALINNLIDFARLEAEELEVDDTPFSITELLEQVVETTDSLLSEGGLRLVVNADAPRDRVRGDPARTRQVLMKLVTNAVKFSEHGTIRIETRVVEDPSAEPANTLPPATRFLALDVRDPGIGISAEEIERVFEPFQQTAGLLNRPQGGTGLGLTIARRLARLQGGDLVATSRPARGSLFTLYLPLAD